MFWKCYKTDIVVIEDFFGNCMLPIELHQITVTFSDLEGSLAI